MKNRIALALGLALFTSTAPFATKDSIQNWVLYQRSVKKLHPVVLVHQNQKLQEHMLKRLKRWQKLWANYRFKPVTLKQFNAEYQHWPLQIDKEEIAFVFYDFDGMILTKSYHSRKIMPSLSALKKHLQEVTAYETFKKKQQSSSLKWPLQALHSNLPGLTLRYLKKTNRSKLNPQERRAYEILKNLAKQL